MSQRFIQEAIGDFLLRRLREVGLSHLFGVPGDFNLEFLEQVCRGQDIQWVGCCNELNAAYAADGYARTRGFSALLTTYGVGELSALCGVAGAYAEHLPVVSIVGAPPLADTEEHALLHHSAADGNFDSMYVCGSQFSVAHAKLTPQNAAAEIDRCLLACLREQRPVYLQLPSDIASVLIRVPVDPLAIVHESDPKSVTRWSKCIGVALNDETSKILLVDADAGRFGAVQEVMEAAERLGCGIAVMASAKGIFDETHPNYIGIYNGAYSKPSVREAVESAGCLIRVGVRLTDATTGSFSQKFSAATVVAIEAWQAACNGETHYGLHMRDALLALAADLPPVVGLKQAANAQDVARVAAGETIQHAWFWQRVEAMLRSGDVIAAENGTSLSGMTGVRLPKETTFLAQAIWGSIGYTLPATFGSLIGSPERRHLLFIGDGSFQLTAQELSSILRHGLKPIIFLINNAGYTIERLILGANREYNDVQTWKYADLPHVFANGVPFLSLIVRTPDEVESAIAQVESADCLVFIEVMTERMDAPETLRKLGPVFARQDYGPHYLDEYSS